MYKYIYCRVVDLGRTPIIINIIYISRLFGSVRSSRNANLCSFFCLRKTCLELTIFIFLSQDSLRSVSGLSSKDRRSMKYFVLLYNSAPGLCPSLLTLLRSILVSEKPESDSSVLGRESFPPLEKSYSLFVLILTFIQTLTQSIHSTSSIQGQ